MRKSFYLIDRNSYGSIDSRHDKIKIRNGIRETEIDRWCNVHDFR